MSGSDRINRLSHIFVIAILIVLAFIGITTATPPAPHLNQYSPQWSYDRLYDYGNDNIGVYIPDTEEFFIGIGINVENVDVNKQFMLAGEGTDAMTMWASDASNNILSNEIMQSNNIAIHVQHNKSFYPMSLNKQGLTAAANNSAKHQSSHSNVSAYSILRKKTDSSWPMSKHNAFRTGYNVNETVLYPPLVNIWVFEGVYGDVFGTISSVNETLYVGMQASFESWGDSNKVYAIDATSGLKMWEFILDGGGAGSMSCTPAVADGLVYFGGQHDNKLYALNAETGQKVWEFIGVGSMYTSHTAVVDGIVYANGQPLLYALDAYTGENRWEFSTGSHQNSPAIVDDTLYIGSSDGFLYALDTKTGTEKWNLSDASRVFSYPVISNDTIYIDTSYIGKLNTVIKALDTKTGFLKWEVILEENQSYLSEGILSLANDILYVSIWEGTNGHSKLYALNASTGLEKWSFDTGALGIFTPVVANRIVYICGWKNGMVYALDAINGVEKWNYRCDKTISSPPMVANGMLYVCAYDKLYAFAEPRVHNINTGDHFSTIQAAIDDASPGDEIHVDAGTYVENVDVNKRLTLVGEGADMVTVLAANSNDHVFEVTVDYVNISGFTVEGATGGYWQGGTYYSVCGIYVVGAEYCSLFNNIAHDNHYGIAIGYSANSNIVIANNASSNIVGICIYSSCNNNNLTDNIVNLNNYYGIRLWYSNNNVLKNNILSDNEYGIWMLYSSYNTLYHNNLSSNTQNAYDHSTNQWDSGSEGNYWSDYTGNDINRDGIGDTPYPIPGGTSVDRYPLIGIRWLPPEITHSWLGINTHWNHWAENLSIYEQKIKNFGIVRDQAWWAGLETSDLTGSEWDHANWNYPYNTETLCGKGIKYQSGLDNLVKLYQDEDSPELLLLLNLKNDNISSFETITADQYYDYVYHVVERYDGDGLDDMPGLIRPVRYFEVGNEVDYISTVGSRHGYLSPKDYVEKRLIPAYNAAKAANKDAVIMGSGLGMGSDLYGNDGQEFNTMYLNAMYDNITKNGGNENNNFYMDKIAIHYYAKPNAEFDKNIKKVEDVIRKYENRDKPIWITEFYPLTEIGQCDTTTGAFARLLTLMFANRIEMPVIYNLKDDSEGGFGLYDVTCEGEEETITPRESIQVIDTVLSTLHSTTSSKTENENIFTEPGKTTYKRVFNNSDKKVTVLWYIDTADPGAITHHEVSPESPQTFTVDVLGTANFSQTSPIRLKIGSKPTYVVESHLPIDVDLYFNRTTTAGVSTERAASFAVGDTLYGKIKTSASTDHLVKTYITITMPDGTCRYAYYDKPDFTPGIDRVLFSDKKVQLYDGVWHATTDDWLWNIYEFTGGNSGIYSWNCWYEDSETSEILGGNSTEYTFSTTPTGTPVDSSTGKGEVYLDSSAGNLENFIAVSPDDMPAMPDSLNPVYGFFSFNITGISGGQSVNIPLAFPENVPTGTEYWKYGPTPDDITPHWYQIPVSDDDGDRIIVITLTDGGIGDDDLTANSVIIDDGGPSLPLRVHNIDTGENFSTIQTAIDDPDTQDGHTITVDAGMYVENVNVNKRVTLIGEGADMVRVQAADAWDHVFEVTADWVNISGFAVTGATGNYKAGIHLNNADRCSILENNVSDNDCGIFIGDSNNNTLYHNNLIHNTQNAYDNSTNQWNSGSKGNYYSDYSGIDADGDGIGDIPYNISGGAGTQDRYPLMQPWNESGSCSEFFSIGSANAPPNSTVTIPVSVANVTNISGISFDLLYNSSVVTVISVSANESFIGSSITPNIDNANGNTRVMLTNSNLISVSAATPVIDIVFNIAGGSGSSTYLDLKNVEFNDSEFNPYTPAVVVDGQITVGIKGDFNGNGRVDIGDAAKVAFMVAGKVPEDLNADFNGNGRVDIGDAAKIAFYLAGKVSEL